MNHCPVYAGSLSVTFSPKPGEEVFLCPDSGIHRVLRWDAT